MKVIGVDLGGTNVRAALVEDDKLLRTVSQKIDSAASQKVVLEQISEVIKKVHTDGVEGIGIGVPSIVDVKEGIVYEVTKIPSWKKVPVKRTLEGEFKVPVMVNNDANCFALGEKYFGSGKKYENLVGLILGTGLGAGLVLNGKLYSGHNCGAGEFCEVIYKDANLEHYCSGSFFERETGKRGEVLSKEARSGDRTALRAFDKFGYHVGKLVSVIVNSVDPEIIVFGGSVSNDFEFFKDSLVRSLKESTFERSVSRLQLRKSTLKNAALLGAATLYYDSLK